MAKAHACLDGNKRIAAALMVLFVEWNGTRAFFPNNELVAFTELAAFSTPADREATMSQLTVWIEARIRQASPGRTQ